MKDLPPLRIKGECLIEPEDQILYALAPEMAEALQECITEEGAAAFLKREYAETRLRYITEAARAILARLPQKGGEK